MRKDRWMTNGGEAGARAVEDGTRQHVLRRSGTVTWCGACGTFAESRAMRLMTVLQRGSARWRPEGTAIATKSVGSSCDEAAAAASDVA